MILKMKPQKNKTMKKFTLKILQLFLFVVLIVSNKVYAQTKLYEAAAAGDIEKVKWLIRKKNADINHFESNDFVPLIGAIKSGNDQLLELLVDRGANINVSDGLGRPPVIVAVENNQLTMVKFLLEKGADIDARGIKNNTVLMNALSNGKLTMARSLVALGAEVNAKNEDGITPFMKAVMYGKRYNILDFLVEHDADIDAKANNGNTAIMIATINEDKEMIKYLKNLGADINIQNNEGMNPLLHAVRTGNLQLTKFIVELGADLQRKDKDGRSVMDYGRLIPVIENYLEDIGAKPGSEIN